MSEEVHTEQFSNIFVICFTLTRNFTKAGGASLEVRVMKRRLWDVSLTLKATALMMDCSDTPGCDTPGIYSHH